MIPATFRRLPKPFRGLGLALLALPLALPCGLRADPPKAPLPIPETPATPQPAASTASLAEYQSRLKSLDRLVAACQSAMTAENCRGNQVGPDIRLQFPAGERQIRFAWLRALLEEASKYQKEQQDAAKAAKPAASRTEKHPWDFEPPTLPEQLAAARKRLAADAISAAQLARPPASQPANPAAPASAGQPNSASNSASSPEPSAARQALERILAAKEFHPAVASPSLLDRLLEKAGNWVDRMLGKLQEAGFQSKWVGIGAEIAFVLALSIAIVWFLIRLERQGRLGLALIRPGPGSGAASARDWQLWLEDARQAAALGAWRDAIHLLYWASISRLESLGLWPADRARTPREYLALLARENSHRDDLTALTRSFERTWYAGRPAAQADFRQAAEVAAKLGVPANPNWGAQ